MDDDDNIYIADYGTCMVLKYESTLLSQTLQATLVFAPPELIKDKMITFKVNNIYINK